MVNARTKKIKSMTTALVELRPYIIDRRKILSGGPIGNFENARPREILGNWVVCAALNENYGKERFFIVSDPTGGDGIIFDSIEARPYFTEHVIAVNFSASEDVDGDKKVVDAINMKRNKGGIAYAEGKILVVLVESIGLWTPNAVRKLIDGDFIFNDIWVFGFCCFINDIYRYAVARIDRSETDCPTWIIEITSDFASFETTRIQ